GMGGFDERLAERLAGVSGVRAAVPVIQTPAAILGRSGAVPVLALGVDPTRDGAARDYQLRSGRGLDEASGVLLEAGFAAGQGFELGQPARLLTAGGLTQLPVVGLLEPYGPAAFNGGAVALPAPGEAQGRFGMTGQVNTVRLVLVDGADPRQVEAAVGRLLPAGLFVQEPAARGAAGRDAMNATENGLATLSVSSPVAGAFVILNAFLMNLGERRRQLAILRALGATRRQITRLLLREALLLGLAGTAL